MMPFDPWMWRDPMLWRDPSALAGGYGQVTPDVEAPERSRVAEIGEHHHDVDLTGYHVEATDGRIGTIDEASEETGASWLVVDTGPWIFGRKVLLPAGTVARIDHVDRVVHVDRTRDEVRNSPGYDPDTFASRGYRDQVGDYYRDVYRDPGRPDGDRVS